MFTVCLRFRRSAVCLMVLFLMLAPTGFAQGSRQQAPAKTLTPEEVNKLPDCKRAGWKQECVIRVNVDGKKDSAVGTFSVASGTDVHLLVFKTPFEKVKFDVERKEAPAPPDPMIDLIKLLSGAAAFTSALSTSSPDFEARAKALAPTTDEERAIIARLTSIKEAKEKRLKEVQDTQAAYLTLKNSLKAFFDGKYCQPGSTVVSTEFEGYRGRSLDLLNVKIKNTPPLSTAGEELLLKTAGDMLQKMSSQPTARPEFIEGATQLMNEASGVIRLLQSAIANLDEARKNFTIIGNTLEDLQNGATCAVDIPQVADRQADLSGNIVFTNLVTGQDDSRKLFAKVSYRDLPRASVSTGILLSALEKRKFSVTQKSDGPGDAPTDNVKSHTEIGSEASRPQVIPFSFINVRLAYWRIGSRMFTFNFAPGVGINPNGGTTEAEFAIGPSVGISNLYLFAGAHFARDPQLAGGFSVGDRVAKDFALPVVRSWKTTFGFGVSYRLPLP